MPNAVYDINYLMYSKYVIVMLCYVTKKIVAGPINSPPRKSPRVKVQTKMDQKVQCKGGGGLKLIFVDQIWLQSFKFNRLILGFRVKLLTMCI